MHPEIFPFGFYGRYEIDEYRRTGNLGLMCREEGLKTCHLFSNITNKYERSNLIQYEKIMNKEFDFKSEIKNNEVFTMFFQEIATSIIDLLAKLNNHD